MKRKYLKPVNLFPKTKYKGYVIHRVVSCDYIMLKWKNWSYTKSVKTRYTYYRTMLNNKRINSSLTLKSAKLFIDKKEPANA